MRALLIGLVLSAGAARAEDDALTLALAKAQGVTPEVLHSVSVKRAGKGWLVQWSREVGEGLDECSATYRTDGSLATLDCTLEYVSHSMGPENARWVTHAVRAYDAKGALTSVKGQLKGTRLSDKVVKERSNITKADDEHLGELSRPMLMLDPPLRP
jgi:hypothetical protein